MRLVAFIWRTPWERLFEGERRRGPAERTYLRLDVEQTSPVCVFDLPDGHEARAVEVPGELGVLNERALADELLEFVVGHEVVVVAVRLAGAGRACRICGPARHGVNCEAAAWTGRDAEQLTGDAEAKLVRKLGEEAFQEGALAYTGRPRYNKGAQEVRGGRHGCSGGGEQGRVRGGEGERGAGVLRQSLGRFGKN